MNYNIRQRKISPEIRDTETNNSYYSFTHKKSDNYFDLKINEIKTTPIKLPRKKDITNSIISFFSSEKKD